MESFDEENYPSWHPAAWGAAEEDLLKSSQDFSGSSSASQSSWGDQEDASESKELSEEQKAREFTHAKNIVYQQLAASAKSRFQLEKKLSDKGISAEIAEDLLQRCEAVGLINDEEYAQMYVRTTANMKKLSRSALRRELKTRGIREEYIEQALAQRSDSDEYEDAVSLVQKKLRPSMNLSDYREKEKIMRRLVSMLGRKGYSSSLAFSVVRSEVERMAEDQERSSYE
ncbi:regulatory protein RecX [Rothia sp. CCM 9418]|uniref:regulatory protein RecX n=1 Tax=Rothia sp. CCM 9418 TaxID=3402661 RepID=UPI003AE4A2A8